MSSPTDNIQQFFPTVNPLKMTQIEVFHYFNPNLFLWKYITTNAYYDYNSLTNIWTRTRIPLNVYAQLAPLEIEEIKKNNDSGFIYTIKTPYPDVDPQNIKYVYKKFDFISPKTYYRDVVTDIYYSAYNNEWELVTDTTTFCLTYAEYLADYELRYQI